MAINRRFTFSYSSGNPLHPDGYRERHSPKAQVPHRAFRSYPVEDPDFLGAELQQWIVFGLLLCGVVGRGFLLKPK